MANGASYSNGTPLHPCAQFIKFTAAENARLHRARKICGETVQTFGHAAVMRAVNDVLAERDEKRRPQAPERREVFGLGIRERLEAEDRERQARREERESAAAPPPVAPAPPVTVNVHAAAAGGGGTDVTALARTVVVAPAHERKEALKRACDALAPQARTSEDAERLGAQLDAEISRLGAAPQQTVLERVRARRKR